jgi:hypothetical protein
VLGLQAAVAAGLAVSCLTHSAALKGFRTLGAREGLPALPDSELALFSGRRGSTRPMQQLARVVLDYFSSPAQAAPASGLVSPPARPALASRPAVQGGHTVPGGRR